MQVEIFNPGSLVFEPLTPTVSLAVSSTSNRVAITAGATPKEQVALFNAGTVPVFVAWGNSAIEAAATGATMGYPIAPGTKETITISSVHTHVAAITASGTATLYITTGVGG